MTTGIHHLKTWPGPFAAIVAGDKTFEWRSTSDRHFEDGDVVELEEWDPIASRYTGRAVCADVGFVLRADEFGVPQGFCAFSLIDIGAVHAREQRPVPQSSVAKLERSEGE